MRELMSTNLYMIYFIYGLSFFISGFIIIFQSLKLSKILYYIRYLGIFFLLHGLADWGPLFYPIQSRIYSSQAMLIIRSVHVSLTLLSFYFLALYGVSMVGRHRNRFKWCIAQAPKLIIALLLIISFILLKTQGFEYWYNIIDVLSRYFLGLPAAIMTGFALKKERMLIKDQHDSRMGKHLQLTYWTFFVYAFFSGIIVEPAAFFPANVINTENFFLYTNFPIQFFRALTGLIIAYSMVVILDIFYLDMLKKLEDAEKEKIIYKERERISQDIHDGTMQALYGVGLRLQYIDALLKDYDNETVKEHLSYTLKKLNETSKEIRSYITNLRPNYENTQLAQEIKNIIKDFMADTNIQVRYDYEQNKNYQIKPQIISQVSFIIKESLNNIRKHANATFVQLTLIIFDGKIEIVIRDNGKGFECTSGECIETEQGGIGLKSMSRRVKELQGSLNICSHKGAGTGISIIIPLED